MKFCLIPRHLVECNLSDRHLADVMFSRHQSIGGQICVYIVWVNHMRNMEPSVLVKNNLANRHFGRQNGKVLVWFDSVAWLASFHIVCV